MRIPEQRMTAGILNAAHEGFMWQSSELHRSLRVSKNSQISICNLRKSGIPMTNKFQATRSARPRNDVVPRHCRKCLALDVAIVLGQTSILPIVNTPLR